MTLVAVTSAGASPGATSLATALAMAWSQREDRSAIMVEADPSGGVIGPRFGTTADPSLMTYSADARRGFNVDFVVRNTQRIADALDVLLAPTDPVIARRVLSDTAASLAQGLATSEFRCVIDLGRLDNVNPSTPFATVADEVLLVTRPRFDEVQSLLYRIRQLRQAGATPSLVVVGEEPHHPAEVADAAAVPLAAVVPDDAAIASAFAGGVFTQSALDRSVLWRAVLGLAEDLLNRHADGLVEAAPSETLDDETPDAEASGDKTPVDESQSAATEPVS